MSEQHKCTTTVYDSSRVWDRGHACGRNAAYEHEGRFFCKTHHPPTAELKHAIKQAAWNAKIDARMAANERARKEAAEVQRRADCYPELLEALVALSASYARLKPSGYPKADSEKQAEAAIAKATGEAQ